MNNPESPIPPLNLLLQVVGKNDTFVRDARLFRAIGSIFCILRHGFLGKWEIIMENDFTSSDMVFIQKEGNGRVFCHVEILGEMILETTRVRSD